MSTRTVNPIKPSEVEEVWACDYDAGGWLWAHGWLNKRQFRGRLLSDKDRYELLNDLSRPAQAILRGEVKHGWVVTVHGDASGCGGDYSIYLQESEPHVVDGHWDGALAYAGDWGEDEDERGAEVADGPHKATWLVPWDGTAQKGSPSEASP